MLGMGEGGRKRGRPRSRWIDGIAADTGMNVCQMVEAAKDRKGWRSIVQAVARGRHRLDSTRLQGEWVKSAVYQVAVLNITTILRSVETNFYSNALNSIYGIEVLVLHKGHYCQLILFHVIEL